MMRNMYLPCRIATGGCFQQTRNRRIQSGFAGLPTFVERTICARWLPRRDLTIHRGSAIADNHRVKMYLHPIGAFHSFFCDFGPR